MLHCITFDSKEINDVLLQFLFSIAFFSAAVKKNFGNHFWMFLLETKSGYLRGVNYR